MLSVVIDVGIPLCAILLMLIAGTEVRSSAIHDLRQSLRATATGSIGQLIITPAIGLATIYLAAPAKVVTAGVLLLSVCPGGGISTYYTYLARANVALSALITALSTVLSLLTMPLWLSLLSKHGQAVVELKEVPIFFIVGQLVLFMLLPLQLGRPSSGSIRNSSNATQYFSGASRFSSSSLSWPSLALRSQRTLPLSRRISA